jgi:hypothetical protein
VGSGGQGVFSEETSISALEKAMQRAWGLHGPAQFKDIGDNRFVVRFTSEGDWKLKEICLRGNNNIVIIIFLVHDNIYIPC